MLCSFGCFRFNGQLSTWCYSALCFLFHWWQYLTLRHRSTPRGHIPLWKGQGWAVRIVNIKVDTSKVRWLDEFSSMKPLCERSCLSTRCEGCISMKWAVLFWLIRSHLCWSRRSWSGHSVPSAWTLGSSQNDCAQSLYSPLHQIQHLSISWALSQHLSGSWNPN